MGAWGLGPFENDDACDWLADLGESGAPSIDEAFQCLLDEAESDCIDSGLGSNAVAAMEILARIKEMRLTGDELLEVSGVDLASLKNAFTPKRQAQALKSAEVVLAESSELQQLWADADQLDKWTQTVKEIVSRLGESAEQQKRIFHETTPKDQQHSRTGKNSKKIYGSTAVSSNRLMESYEFIVDITVDRIEKDLESDGDLSQFKDPDFPTIGAIHALRILIEAHRPRHIWTYYNKTLLDSWKSKLVPHLQKNKEKIPEEFRDGFQGAVTDDFDFLQKMLDLVE